MDSKNNIIKAIRFERPDYIPMRFVFNDSCWQNYPQDFLFEMMETHSFLFPEFVMPSTEYVPKFSLVARKDEPYKDDFGCVWHTTVDGITGTVLEHPLPDWSDFKNYKFPDPEVCMGIGPIDWNEFYTDIRKLKESGQLTMAGLRHGHTFLQLCDIRGYQNLLFDMVDEEPDLIKLIDGIEQFNLDIVNRIVDSGCELIGYPEDLGMQNGPMISPELFRKYIKPSYQRIMKPARENDRIVHMHSDGNIHELVDDIIAGGVDVINLQDLVNGIEWIAERFAGKTCVDLDIDRQSIIRYGTPEQVDELIRKEVSTLGRPEGGLMMVCDLYPSIPIENVKALMDAMERYAFYFN